jgi:hypothetical protein
MSAHEPLPTQLLFFLMVTALEGHAPAATHLPLQTTDGSLHAQVVGLLGGEGVKPSVHWNAQGLPLTQAGVLWSG